MGGGPAGLALASELSKKHSLLLIEKNKIGITHKTWTTEEKIINNAGLEEAISIKFDKCFLETTDKEQWYIYDKFVSLDENKVLQCFINKIKVNGGKLLERCTLNKTDRTSSHITLETSHGDFRSRLLIDCTGIESPLAAQHNVIDRRYYCPVYGEILTSKQTDLIKLEDSYVLIAPKFKGRPLILYETFPVSKRDNTIVMYTFQYLLHKDDPHDLKNKHLINKQEYEIKNHTGKLITTKEVYGIIPLGSTKKTAVDRIFFFGDTDGPVTAFGFSMIMSTFKNCARHISDCLEGDTLDEKHLNISHSWKEKLNRDFQNLFSTILIHATSQQTDYLLKRIQGLKNKAFIDFIFLRLSPEEIAIIVRHILNTATFQPLLGLIPKRECMYLLEKIGEVFLDGTAIEMKKNLILSELSYSMSKY